MSEGGADCAGDRARAGRSGDPLISIVVPTLDEAAALPSLLDHLGALPGRWELLLADGGSCDGTVAIAEAHPLGVRVVGAPPGRARQQNAAAAVAHGAVLVFLHADSRLPTGAYGSLRTALERGREGGNFRLRFDGDDRFARALTAWYGVQRRLGVFYGDSTIWVRRDRFLALGGFPEIAIMEDYAIARALVKGGRTTCLPGPATTSSRRWRALGVQRTVASWLVIRWLWLAGVPPDRLAALYRRVR